MSDEEAQQLTDDFRQFSAEYDKPLGHGNNWIPNDAEQGRTFP